MSDSQFATVGEIVYHDNRDDFYFRSGGESALDLKTTIGRVSPKAFTLGSNTHRTLRAKSILAGLGETWSLQWTVEYDYQASDAYGTSDYRVTPTLLPEGLRLAPFSTKALRAARSLPFLFFQGRWKEGDIRVVATRSFGLSDTDLRTENAWSSLLNDYQRFQVQTPDGRLLGELTAQGGAVVCRYRYGVAREIGEQDQPAMIRVLAAIASLHRFLDAANNYRTGWSPDLSNQSGGTATVTDWPEF